MATGTPCKIIKARESYGFDFYVYHGDKLVGVYPSEDMATAAAAREESAR
jgi:hypothetical protein